MNVKGVKCGGEEKKSTNGGKIQVLSVERQET